ncbi:hypothetical protein GO755_21055 [Spirosoma sp. HMF4905]|uniref:Lipocalin-like domain-containing protein n=1 Tax=Spirosoma arboris TaxID=2682092 RepID=A0A7K1SFG2_9BACT|nr:hypothetical protein [Spirosoma arboris]MVM32542.1 hypothetical protein [Spirosoma arboris]
MKKYNYGLLLLVVTAACSKTVDPDTASAVEGLYQLTEYDSPTTSDTSPTGALSVTRLDAQHVKITVKGTSGKTKIAYTLASVLVANIDRDSYDLSIKGKSVGKAGEDVVSRYVNLTPVSSVTLSSVEF